MLDLKKAALTLCLAACLGVGFADKTYAEEALPSSGIEYADLDAEINRVALDLAAEPNSFDCATSLTLLYYDRGYYRDCYKMSKRSLGLYENGFGYVGDDDLVRETLVKGAAAAYNVGEYRDAEKLLNHMIKLNLNGSEENQKTYMGWAYYYLSNIERVRGNYDRAHFYGGIAIDFCPHHDVFIDYWGGFIRIGVYWRWRHHHPYYRPPMLPPRHHWRDHHGHRPVVHRPAPPHRPGPVVHRPAPNHRPGPVVHRPAPNHHPGPVVHKPTQQRPTVQRQAPNSNGRPVMHRPSQQRPTVQRQAPNTQPRPNMQHPAQPRPNVQRQAPNSNGRPVMHRQPQQRSTVQRQAPNTNGYPYPEMQRPQQRPTYQPRPNMQRPAQSRPTMQRQAPSRGQYRPHGNMQRRR